MFVRFGATLARGQPQRCRHRQDEQAVTHGHQRVLLEAVPEGEVAVALLVLESVLPVALPLTEPVEPVVPVAPIDVVPLVVEPGVVVVLVLAVPVPLSDAEPVVEPGVVDAVDELVEGDVGVVLLFVVEDVVDSVDSRLVQAPRERAATTARAAPAAWVRVIFIRNSLVGADTTLGRHSSRRVGTGSKRM